MVAAVAIAMGRAADGISESQCRAVIDLAERATCKRHDRCPPAVAADYADRILGCYRARDYTDPKVFAMALVATLVERHPAVVALAADPVYGIPRKRSFLPSIAEVADDLDGIERRLELAAVAAQQCLGERPVFRTSETGAVETVPLPPAIAKIVNGSLPKLPGGDA